ncbi:MAG: hypothetical protein WKF83_14165 [Nocardioidaceae bacterium]
MIPPTGHLADFLTPIPRRRHLTFAEELAIVSGSDESAVIADLDHLLAGSLDPRARRLLEEGRRDVALLLRRVVDELHGHWVTTIQPLWARLRAVAEADVSWRLEQIADSRLATGARDPAPTRARERDRAVGGYLMLGRRGDRARIRTGAGAVRLRLAGGAVPDGPGADPRS